VWDRELQVRSWKYGAQGGRVERRLMSDPVLNKSRHTTESLRRVESGSWWHVGVDIFNISDKKPQH